MSLLNTAVCPDPPEMDDAAARVLSWLARFDLHADLAAHVSVVLVAMPPEARGDILDDPHFILCEYEHTPQGTSVPVGFPRSPGAPHHGGRSVALKRRLRAHAPAFIRWVVAHELAHAHLRNEGRHPGEDPELAADALAAEWGFPKPAAMPW